MKKTLLIAAVLGMTATTAWADGNASKYDTAIEAQIGENKYNLDTETPDSVVWKFTADKNYLAQVGPLAGSYDYVYVSTIVKNNDTQKNDTIDMSGASVAYPDKLFPFIKGNTYYITIVTKGETGMNLNVEENDDIEGGLDKDKPVDISAEHNNFVGKALATGYDTYEAYAKYAATGTGILVLTCSNYFSVSCADKNYTGEYSSSTYQIKVPVEAEKNYDFTFSIYTPLAFKAEMTHPTAGSLDIPFEAADGENTVPADSKDYYYTYTPTTAGYLNITSEKPLTGGCVKVYDSKYSIQYDQVKAQSETGSYNVRVEVASVPTSPYYILVSRKEKVEQDETFNIAMEPYKEGETEDTPIAIGELPATTTLPTAQGTYFYTVSVTANTEKFLHLETGLDSDAAYGTQVAIYPQGSSIFSGVKGTDNLDLAVNNNYDQNYIIKVTSAEATPITFTVSYKDINKGDLITNPMEAVLGENTITANGTRFYTYTPTTDCKLVLTATPEMTVSFPMGTGAWAGNYDVIQTGTKYYFGVTKDTPYLIKLENTKEGDVFTLAEEQFQQGEDRQNPVVVTGSEYTLPKEQASSLWLSYTAKQEGMLTIYCDAPYNYNNAIEYGKKDAAYLYSMMSTEYDDTGEGKTVYRTTFAVNAGDEILLHSMMNSVDKDYTITFTERNFKEGETAKLPIVLEEGKTVTIPATTSSSAIWVKAKLGKGKAEFTANGYLSGYIYTSLENAEQDNYDRNFYFSADYTITDRTVYNFSYDVEAEGDYYFNITSSNGNTELLLKKSNVTTDGISGTEAAAKGSAAIYSINGTKMAGSLKTLKPGIYVICADGKTKKVVVE
ncbi:hypothetical protein [Prevotella sp.]|uniref:hypothetical protein n=1 Tax=Prevotella sp. TaxID=59823 RepID=UPI003FD8C2D7